MRAAVMASWAMGSNSPRSWITTGRFRGATASMAPATPAQDAHIIFVHIHKGMGSHAHAQTSVGHGLAI